MKPPSTPCPQHLLQRELAHLTNSEQMYHPCSAGLNEKWGRGEGPQVQQNFVHRASVSPRAVLSMSHLV